jgi:hypothetical protein
MPHTELLPFTGLLDGIAICFTAWMLWANTLLYPEDLLIILLWPVVVLLWVIRSCYLLFVVMRRRAPIRGYLLYLLLIPALAAASWAAASSDALWQLRLQRSRPALDQAAALILQDHPDAPRDGDRIGLCTVSVIDREPGVVHLYIDGFGGWFSTCGLAYSPAGRPMSAEAGEGSHYLEHLGGAWYRRCYEW